MIFHIVSGQAFFSGMLLMMVAVGSFRLRPKHRPHRILKWATVFGAVLVVISATPLPDWYHVLFGGILGAWLGSHGYVREISSGFLVLIVVGIALELPYHLVPQVSRRSFQTLTVIGDSVAAGTGRDDATTTWPKLLAEDKSLRVQDLSHMGETAGSALKRLRATRIKSDIVLIEIGGNDMLGTTSPVQFHRDLEALLLEVRRQTDAIYMFELPLPPFFDQYGKSQRSLARRYGVTLIPKRYFASIILNAETTSDSIHLTQAGHNRMETIVKRFLNLER